MNYKKNTYKFFIKLIIYSFIILYSSYILSQENKKASKKYLIKIHKNQNIKEVIPNNIELYNYIDTLISKADKLNLYKDKYWNLLLHKKPNSKKFKSEVDDSTISTANSNSTSNKTGNFFLNLNGKNDSRAELYSNIISFFEEQDTQVEENLNNHTQCRFPLRFLWLNSKLHFDKNFLPKVKCPGLELWFKILDYDEITLVFASHFLGAPSSTFGHTFLKVSSKRFAKHDLLSYTINYAANVPDNTNIIDYFFKGFGGGFRGVFNVYPYHLNVKEYNDIDKRDLWEYKLNLNRDEIKLLLLHTVELEEANFKYYFFKENCSYNILSLIEIARPELDLRSKFKSWTIPTETIKLLFKNNVITKVNYRPSHLTVVKQRIEKFTKQESELFYNIVSLKKNSDIEFDRQVYKNLEVKDKIFFLDTILFSLKEDEEVESTDYKAKKISELVDKIIKKRLALPLEDNEFKIEQREISPHLSHSIYSIGFKTGVSNYGTFLGINFRPPLHDILNRGDGFPKNSAIILLNTDIRYYEGQKFLNIYNINFIKIISLPVYEKYNHSSSYLIDLKIDTEFLKKNDYNALNFSNNNKNLILANTFELLGLGGVTLNIDEKTKSNYSLMVGGNYKYAFGRGIFRHTIAPVISNRFLFEKNLFKGELLINLYNYNLVHKIENEFESIFRFRFIVNPFFENNFDFVFKRNYNEFAINFLWHL